MMARCGADCMVESARLDFLAIEAGHIQKFGGVVTRAWNYPNL